RWVLTVTIIGIVAGLVAHFAGQDELASLLWAGTTLFALVPLTADVVRALWKSEFGVDIIALLAMAGALLLGQFLAGAVVALMLSGGNVLEDYADARARRELSALLSRAPRVVHRYREETVESADIADVKPGDLLLVKPGEVIPVDGVVLDAGAVIDESALTGEPLPVEREAGELVRSGTVNAARSPFRMRASSTAEQSTYAGIVRLVQQAQASKAPLVRLADRYALILLPMTLTVAA